MFDSLVLYSHFKGVNLILFGVVVMGININFGPGDIAGSCPQGLPNCSALTQFIGLGTLGYV